MEVGAGEGDVKPKCPEKIAYCKIKIDWSTSHVQGTFYGNCAIQVFTPPCRTCSDVSYVGVQVVAIRSPLFRHPVFFWSAYRKRVNCNMFSFSLLGYSPRFARFCQRIQHHQHNTIIHSYCKVGSVVVVHGTH